MFSGLIVASGTVRETTALPAGGLALQVTVQRSLAAEVKPSDSVCINGVCLTATEVSDDRIHFDVVPETISRSTLANLREAEQVNVELALRVGDRMGGHFVYGHVDGCVKVVSTLPQGQGRRFAFELPDDLRSCVVEKGFIAIDGISLTIAAVASQAFEVAVIPETLRRTTLLHRQPGSLVNVEVDPLARYIAGAIRSYDQDTISKEELAWAYEI